MNNFLGWCLLVALLVAGWAAAGLWSAGPLVAVLAFCVLAGAAMIVIGALAFVFDPHTGGPGSRFGEAHLRDRRLP